MNALELLVPVMLIAGFVGGLIGFFVADPTADPANERPLPWWKHVVIGVGASFTVPVFLNTISSPLISEITGELSDAKVVAKLLVLTGFCLLAAVSSRVFLRSLSERVLQAVKGAKEQADKAREGAEATSAIVVDPFIEDDGALVEQAPGHILAKTTPTEVTDSERKILKAMTTSKFVMRSLTGLAKDADLAKEIVNATISTLLEKGLISEAKNKVGQPRWYATSLGRSIDQNDS
ncbi:MAG: YEATS-associated helix-containing protein [Acidiferrobacteraceae bacterium]